MVTTVELCTNQPTLRLPVVGTLETHSCLETMKKRLLKRVRMHRHASGTPEGRRHGRVGASRVRVVSASGASLNMA